MFGQTDASLFTRDRKAARSRYSKNEIYCTMHFNGLRCLYERDYQADRATHLGSCRGRP